MIEHSFESVLYSCTYFPHIEVCVQIYCIYIYIYGVRMYYKTEVAGDASRERKKKVLLHKRRNRLLIFRKSFRAISLLLPYLLFTNATIFCASAGEP